MATRKPKKVRRIADGKDYRIKKITGQMVVLESEDRQEQILTDVDNLKLFYLENRDESHE
jgi:hypothetical protein